MNTTSSTASACRSELPGAFNLTVGYTGSRGKDMFIRGVANMLDFGHSRRLQPTFGQIDYKTSGCVDGLVINRPDDPRLRLRRATTRCSSVCRAASAAA